jgi:hypothetical protein
MRDKLRSVKLIPLPKKKERKKERKREKGIAPTQARKKGQ